jgi:hypothetical protein
MDPRIREDDGLEFNVDINAIGPLRLMKTIH